MECAEVREHLSAIDRQVAPVKGIIDHLAGCEACRLEQGKYLQLQSAMSDLSGVALEPPGWLLASLTETTLERMRRAAALKAATRQLGTPKLAGGAILLAGVAGAIVLRRSKKRSRRGGAGLLEAA